MNKNILISVVMITYGHEKYIKKAIESVLNQKLDYKLELIIANDCSPDNTDNIVTNIIQTHRMSSSIKYFRHNINKGMMSNFSWALNQAKGSYVAICEGDDYWTDEEKLNKQISFLAQNSVFSFCFHSVKVINSSKDYKYHFSIPKKSVLTIKHIILKHYIPTCSVVFRKEFLPDTFPQWFEESIVGDIPIEIMLASKGPIKYLNQNMAVYRKHESGITLNKGHQIKARHGFINLYKNLSLYFNGQYWLLLNFMVLKNYLGITKDYVTNRLKIDKL
jgi:glycosyltransferase involved in cell wall biosynthesis